jgi:hypothetical protein
MEGRVNPGPGKGAAKDIRQSLPHFFLIGKLDLFRNQFERIIAVRTFHHRRRTGGNNYQSVGRIAHH